MSKKPKSRNKQKPKANNAVTTKNPKRDWLIAGLILLVTMLVFSQAIQSDFVNWDDDVNITGNNNVKELNAGSVKRIFTERVIGGYTPLTTLSFAVEHHFFGLNPKVYHLNNILLHLACTLLVFLLLRKLGLNIFIVSLVTLLFGIHPMRVESVAWITERKDVLYAFFFLLATLLYISYYSTRKLIFYFLSLAVFILSLLSKIQAVSLPLALLLIDFHFEGRFRFRQIINKAPYFALSLAFGIAGIFFLKEMGSLDTGTIIPIYQRFFIGTYSFLVYVIKAVLPYQMSAIYPFPSTLSVWHYLSLPIVLGLAFGIWKMKKYRKEVIFGTLFFLFNIAFVLQVVGAGQGYLADRFTYIPYIGLFFIIAFFIDELRQGNLKIPILAATGVGMLVLGIFTVKRVGVWENTETLFKDVLAKYPKVAVAHNNMGKYYREHNEYDKAIASYTEAIRIKPEGFNTYSNRGKAYFDLGRVELALDDFNKCLEINPDFVEALSNRGAALSSKGQYAEALVDLDKAIRLSPANPTAYSNRALTHYSARQFNQCVDDVSQYLKLKPNDADLINLRALAYAELGENAKAIEDFNRAIVLNPKQGVFYQNRSFYYYRSGDKVSALRDISQAQSLGVKANPDYLRMLQTP